MRASECVERRRGCPAAFEPARCAGPIGTQKLTSGQAHAYSEKCHKPTPTATFSDLQDPAALSCDLQIGHAADAPPYLPGCRARPSPRAINVGRTGQGVSAGRPTFDDYPEAPRAVL